MRHISKSFPGVKALDDVGFSVAEGEVRALVGENGAGHFVKMVHNGIEYADMQVIGEAYDILRRGLGMDAEEIGDVFAEWNKGDLDSYLIEITAEILHHKDAETGKPFVDVVVDHAGMKGTGTGTVQTGLECGSPVAAIGEAVFARALSSHGELREDAQKEGLAGPNKTIDLAGEDKAAFVEDVRKALFASKVVAYAQGLNEIQDGAKEYGWISTCPKWPAFGVAAALFAPSSCSTASPRPSGAITRRLPCCSIRTSRRSSANRRMHGVA